MWGGGGIYTHTPPKKPAPWCFILKSWICQNRKFEVREAELACGLTPLFHRWVKRSSEKGRDLLKITKKSLATGFSPCLCINPRKDSNWLSWVTCSPLHQSLYPEGSPNSLSDSLTKTNHSSLRRHRTGFFSGLRQGCYLFKEAFLNHSTKRRPPSSNPISLFIFLNNNYYPLIILISLSSPDYKEGPWKEGLHLISWALYTQYLEQDLAYKVAW